MSNDHGSDSVSDDSRQQGVEFGDLQSELEDESYPITQSELLTNYGDRELDFPDGSTTVRSVLDAQIEAGETHEYDSVGAVEQAILNMVGTDAIGREGYSDRGGSVESDDETGTDQSL